MSNKSTTVNLPLMELTTAAEQLGLGKGEDVKRLIAKRHLQGRQLANERWRVAESSLTAYINAGMKDLSPRRIYQGWFDSRYCGGVAGRFVKRVKDTLAAGFPKYPPKKAGDFTVKPNTKLQALIDEPITQSLDPRDEATRFKTSAGGYAGSEIQLAARRKVHANPGPLNPMVAKSDLDRLYDSPEEFAAFTVAAAAEFLSGAISVTRKYQRDQKQVPVTISLPHSALGLNIDEIVQLAF